MHRCDCVCAKCMVPSKQRIFSFNLEIKPKSSYRFHSTPTTELTVCCRKTCFFFSSVSHLCFKHFGSSIGKEKTYQTKEMKETWTKNIQIQKGTEQIDNFIFISFQIKFILVISLFIRGNARKNKTSIKTNQYMHTHASRYAKNVNNGKRRKPRLY